MPDDDLLLLILSVASVAIFRRIGISAVPGCLRPGPFEDGHARAWVHRSLAMEEIAESGEASCFHGVNDADLDRPHNHHLHSVEMPVSYRAIGRKPDSLRCLPRVRILAFRRNGRVATIGSSTSSAATSSRSKGIPTISTPRRSKSWRSFEPTR